MKDVNEATSLHPAKPKHSMMGIFLIMLGAFSFSIMFLTVKLMANVNTFTLVFYRSVIQILISLASLLDKGVNPLGPPDVRWELTARAVFGGDCDGGYEGNALIRWPKQHIKFKF